ncbi:iron uptake porin [Acaryochloris sp. CCMEE 5410]|uniref:iron uptake porin n=1 Tax=Acaryochloris sp. CCMEE 5410 TaxID=310037 RepID=UPI0002483FA1|nr:iron uptake porin [Acaryochloris sp. CCMEE 5410]KAI9130755.1 carbohydrate porin [Acaryochloris sp. CCMEE 5410]
MTNIRDKSLVFSSLALWACLLPTAVGAVEPAALEEVQVDTTAIPSLELALNSEVNNSEDVQVSLAPSELLTEVDVKSDEASNSSVAEVESLYLADQSTATSPSVAELMEETQTDSVGQVTSVSQLSDVQPDDWAFQAIQSLVERYGCVAGYPNGTFRPSRAMSRREAAALVNACLDNLSNRFATKEDLDALKALQDEFAAELATLRGRVDGLEARVATVEAQQFSTTTKLSVDAVFTAQFGDSDNQAFDNSSDGLTPGVNQLADSRASAIGSVYMSFNTSFSGDDLLQTTLFFGNNGQDLFSNAQVGSTATLPFAQSAPLFNPGQYYFAGLPNNATLYRLAYTFKPVEDLAVTIAPLYYPTDIIDGNSYTSPFTGFSTWFLINNPLITPYVTNFLGGAGAGFDWNFNGGPVSLRGAYVAVNGFSAVNTGPPSDGGLVGDPYQATAELEYAGELGDDSNFAIKLQFTNSETFGVQQNVVGVNAEAKFGQFGVFGRYGYSFADGQGVANPIPFAAGTVGRFDAQTWQAGAGIHDLLVPGSLFAVSAGMPFLNNLPSPGVGINDEDQINLEAFYRFPVNDNITISPIFSAILNPNSSSIEPNLYQGLLRVVFSF